MVSNVSLAWTTYIFESRTSFRVVWVVLTHWEPN